MEFPLFNTSSIRRFAIMSKSSLKSLASIALESERIEEQQVVAQQEQQLFDSEMAEPVTNEPELIDADNERRDVEIDFDDEQSENAALEQLAMYRDVLEHQIKTKTVSMESIALVQMGVQNVYATQGVRLRSIAQESNMSAEAYGQIVLESIFGAIGNSFVLPIKRWKDRITDLFRSSEAMANKYRQKLESAREELNQKKGTFRGDAEVNMHELWAFFSTGAGQVTNITGEMQKDLAMSKYVLVDYPQQVLKAITAFSQVLQSANFTSPESTKAAGLAMEKLVHPAELFNKQFITGDKKPFLGVTGIELKVGSQRKAQAIAGVGFPKLAELATAKSIRESGSFTHGAANLAGKLGGKVVGNVVNGVSMALSKNTRMNAQQVDQAITLGEEYIRNVEAYKKIEPQLQNALEASWKAFQHAFGGKMLVMGEIGRVVSQMQQYSNNLSEACFQPAAAEVSRSLRGARFTAYLARRAIYHKSDVEDHAKGNTNDAAAKPAAASAPAEKPAASNTPSAETPSA